METNNLTIVPMTLNDLEQIANVLETDFDDFWNYNILKSELENPNSKYFVAKINNEIVGFSGVLLVLDVAEITNIVVKKNFRNLKIATNLMEAMIDFCKIKNISKINLEVNSCNTIAINLYKKFEFKEVGNRKNYYKNGDGLLYTKNLI